MGEMNFDWGTAVVEYQGRDVRVWALVDLCDEGAYMSLTNGAERAIHHLYHHNGWLPDLVIYKDTMGNWDRMIPVGSPCDGDFRVRFAPIEIGRKGDTFESDEEAIFEAIRHWGSVKEKMQL